jgi:hypothetical protein
VGAVSDGGLETQEREAQGCGCIVVAIVAAFMIGVAFGAALVRGYLG